MAGLQGEDAGDVAQEVFSAVARGIGGFRRERAGDTFRGWLRSITRHKLADHFRCRRDRPCAEGGTSAQQAFAQVPAVQSSDWDTAPDADNRSGVELQIVELVKASVEERTWQAFWRTVVDGRPADEVAAELAMSVKAVYEAKYRVLRRLRAEFEQLLD
jgi:RNA polymerase sigma-70 factor (ECF subfamily)